MDGCDGGRGGNGEGGAAGGARPWPALSGRSDGGDGFDRAAWLRTDPVGLAARARDPETRIVPFWRGRPAIAPEGAAPDPVVGSGLVAVRPGNPLLAHVRRDMSLLGLAEGRAVFAADVSAWSPDAPDAHPARQGAPGLPPGAGFEDTRAALPRLGPRSGEIVAVGRALLNWHGAHGFCAACGAPTNVAMAGWQRLCPSCGAEHFPRTDPVVIMCVTRGSQVLLGRSPGWREGLYSCLAGFVEPGETPEAAVRREVAEETAVRIGAARYLAAQPWPFPCSLMLGFHAEALTEAITADPKEIEAALWVSRDRLAAILAGADGAIRPPTEGSIARWLLREWLADRAG